MESNTKLNGVFSAENIKSYWKNQSPHNGNGKFTDVDFPPNVHSLYAQDKDGAFIDTVEGASKAGQISAADIEWKRASEIFGKYQIFDTKIECSDVNQGNLGNCYFLCSIAALSEFPQLILQIFRIKEVNAAGYYEIVLFIDGEWKIVTVDDYFPVNKGTNTFSFAKPNGNELWVVLLEKAWAKINGGYANIISGWPSDPLATLTGFATQKLSHKDYEKNTEEMWKILKMSDQADNIMCTSTKSDGSGADLGLVTNHAYTLIGAKEATYKGEHIRLVKIRNPWGHKEWSGDWSDSSSLWTPELKQIFEHGDADDGTFYMSFTDFVKLWECTHVCHMMYDSNIKSFTVESDGLKKPHVFNLYLNEDSRVAISMITKHWRFNRQLRNVDHPFSLVIAKYNTTNHKLSEVEGEYLASGNLEYIKALTKGLYAVWIYCAYDHCDNPKPEEYQIRFISGTKYRVKLENYDENFDFIREMITAGFRETFKSDIEAAPEFFNKIDNSFKRTGIGYRCIVSNISTKYQKWTNDASGVQKMFMFPPNEGKDSFELWVPPMGSGICLGMRTEQWGTYWFNVGATYSTISCQAGENPTPVHTVNLQDFITNDVSSHDIDDSYYDYISSSHDQARKELSFNKLNLNDIAEEDLKSKYPHLMEIIYKIPGPDDDSFTWTKQTFDNGYYVGQISVATKNRHGRGIYHWDDTNLYYAGFWENNAKGKWGQILDADFKVTYKGDYVNGLKHGHGEYYFNNGDCHVGQYVKDKKQGHGSYKWAGGAKWDGNFENGQMNGFGDYYDGPGDTGRKVEFKKGQYVA